MAWAHQHAAHAESADAAVVRRDMVTLLSFVRDNKVVGTQSTGNMPLKAVREVSARFTHPPELDVQVGERLFRLRSEEDVWALYFVHNLAVVAGLLKTGRARRWTITREAARFLEADARIQAAFLLVIWWYRVNWIVAFPFHGMGDELPPRFRGLALATLRGLPTGVFVSYREYASELIRTTGLRWGAPDATCANQLLRAAVERMVVDVLADFGALECQRVKQTVGTYVDTELSAIQVTPWGKALLDVIFMVSSEP